MSLTRYTQARLVVLGPETPVYDAARAMEDNHIGAVVVHDGDRPLGLVTDRDLALEIVGGDLDPFETRLRDVVSTPAIMMPETASEADAARLMINEQVRRILIMDGTELVGIVTLDDLILEHAADPTTCAAIVRAQLSQPTRLKRAGTAGPDADLHGTDAERARIAQRHTARAKRAYDRLINLTLMAADLSGVERASAALEEVVSGLVRRIRPDEARQLLSQLPSLISERISPEVEEPDLSITRSKIERAVALRLSVDRERASEIVRRVGRVLVQSVSDGEIEDVRGQLPSDLKELLEPVPRAEAQVSRK